MSFDVKGAKELEKALKDLMPKEARKVVKTAVRLGAKPLLETAKNNAPVKTGRLRKAIKSRVWRNPDKGEAGQKVFINPGANSEDTKGAYYGNMIDSGHISKDGTFIPGAHFMDKAYALEQQASDMTIKEIENGIMRVAKTKT